MPADIPTIQGPARGDLPEWACVSLANLHMAIAQIYKANQMYDAETLHVMESVRLQNLESSTAILAKEIERGFEPQVLHHPNCSECGTALILDFDGKCKACGFQHVTYDNG